MLLATILAAAVSKPVAYDFPHEWYALAAEGHFWLEWRLAAFLNQLADLDLRLDVAWRGIDIGCGHGILRQQIEHCTRWSVDGADLNEQALRGSMAERGATLFYNIHDRRKEFEAAYDCVILFDVIEHIEDSRGFLESALFHLKPGGWLFINVPAQERFRSAYDTAAGHLRRYDRAMMMRELGNHPLEVRDVRYWGLTLVPLLLLRTMVTSTRQSTREIIEKGFEPPAPWINTILKLAMRLETRALRRPMLGTSLLAAARYVLPSGRSALPSQPRDRAAGRQA